MNRRTTTMAMVGLAIVFATALPQIGFTQSNPFLGTWKLNLAKSTFSPGPAPRSRTLTYQAEGQGIRVTFEYIDAEGNVTKGNDLVFDDGKSRPVAGNPAFDAHSFNLTASQISAQISGEIARTCRTSRQQSLADCVMLPR